MTDQRLPQAFAEGLALPEGRIAVFEPAADQGLSALPRGVEIVAADIGTHAAMAARGYRVTTAPEGDYAAVLVCLPRAKEQARALIAEAAARAPLVIVDGQKTDGVESLLKACRTMAPVSGQLSKAHGKLFWFENAAEAYAPWRSAGPVEVAPGFVTRAGVFSADGIDPASAMLAEALPPLKGRVADLGAGWGFLAAKVLESPDVTEVMLVESNAVALDCAKANITDPRARFLWSDVTTTPLPGPMDAVVMNPPFHVGRDARPELGREFIRVASGLLTRRGQMWMVANRHLGYEAVLDERFASWREVGGDGRFKLVHAEGPKGR